MSFLPSLFFLVSSLSSALFSVKTTVVVVVFYNKFGTFITTHCFFCLNEYAGWADIIKQLYTLMWESMFRTKEKQKP